MITQDKLKKILKYYPLSGHFVWIKPPKEHPRMLNRIAGSHRNGYIQIKINNKKYASHRLAWLYMNGVLPDEQIDHKNGIRDDNRWSNLRQATHSENVLNHGKVINGSGLPVGVRRSKNKYQARITFNGEVLHLGTFQSSDLAYTAYIKKRRELFGEFHRVN